MMKQLILILMCLVGTAGAQQTAQVQKFANAIARTEGFYVKHSVPSRTHNPGDIRSRLAHAYPGQVGLYHGYVVFRSDKWGWSALYANINRIIDGTSKFYTQNMTIAQIAKIYAESPHWLNNICKILRIAPTVTFAQYFDLPAQVLIKRDSISALRFPQRIQMPILMYGATLIYTGT